MNGPKLSKQPEPPLSFYKKAAGPPPTSDPKNPSIEFWGEWRMNTTNASTTAPGARLYKKAAGQQVKLCFLRTPLTEKRPRCWWASLGHTALTRSEFFHSPLSLPAEKRWLV